MPKSSALLLYNGATGSLGSAMPKTAVAVSTRLEATSVEMSKELAEKSDGKPFAFVHFAGMVRPEDCERRRDEAYAFNVDGSEKWYRACIASGATHFIYVSTAHVYAPSNEKLKIGDPLAVRTTYARTKRDAEARLTAITNPVTPITIARVFSVLPQMLRPGYLLTGLHDRAKRKDLSPIPGLNSVRDFLTSEEVCKKLVAWAKHPPKKIQVVNVCSGEGKTIREIAAQVFKEHGLDPSKLTEAPGRVDDVIYMVGEPTPLP